MYIYIFHSKLFGSPRIITSSFPISANNLYKLVNSDNDYLPENKWILQEIPLYPEFDKEPTDNN